MRPFQRDTEPYCRFKDDRSRLRALISRDVRIVLIAVAVVASGPLETVAKRLGDVVVAAVSR